VVVIVSVRYRYILYTYIYLFTYFGSVAAAAAAAAAEVRRNASPENRCRYCLVNDFDGFAVDDIIAVFTDVWVVGVPFLEIDVNIVVAYGLRGIGIAIGGG
jgi:hypothetical protein